MKHFHSEHNDRASRNDFTLYRLPIAKILYSKTRSQDSQFMDPK